MSPARPRHCRRLRSQHSSASRTWYSTTRRGSCYSLRSITAPMLVKMFGDASASQRCNLNPRRTTTCTICNAVRHRS